MPMGEKYTICSPTRIHSFEMNSLLLLSLRERRLFYGHILDDRNCRETRHFRAFVLKQRADVLILKMESRPFLLLTDRGVKNETRSPKKVHTSLAAYNAARCTFATRINIYLHEARAHSCSHTHTRTRIHTGNRCTESAYPHSTAHTRVYDTGTKRVTNLWE